MSPRPVLIDCDPGIDDALALILALNAPEEIAPLGITTVAGNKPLTKTTANALRILELLGRDDVPVWAGSTKPLSGMALEEGSFHGQDGLGDIGLPKPSSTPNQQPAVEALIETVMARPPDSVTLCALGPLTNIALALEREPRFAGRLQSLMIMGGALDGSTAEFNFRCDPLAADRVLSSDAAMELYDLDLCGQAQIADPLRRALADHPAAMTRRVVDLLEAFATRSQCLYDVTVIARLLRPDLVSGQPRALSVETVHPDRAGCCFGSDDPTRRRIVAMTSLDGDGLLDLLTERYRLNPSFRPS